MTFDRSQRVKTSFSEIHVAEAGAIDAPPIVFLHGNPDSHHVWSGVVEHLKTTHRCIAPDLPGYGASEEMRDVTLEAQSAFVLELFDRLELARSDLVIHDVGLTHGLAFIGTGENAARVRTLTMMNGNFFPDYHWHFWARLWRTPLLGEIVMLLGFEGLFVQQVLKDAPKMPVEYARAAYASYRRKTRRQVLRWYREANPGRLRGWDERALAAMHGIRHQVIWGDRDPYIPKSTADRLGVHGTVHHLDDLSHWAMAEDPARVARLIRELIISAI